MIYRAFFIVLIMLTTSSEAMTIEQDSTQRSMDYVSQLDLDCTLTDGYVCADIEEDSFMQPESWQKLIPAAYMLAWQASSLSVMK